MSDLILLVKSIPNPVPGGARYVHVCCHADDCQHGMHGAAIHLLKGLTIRTVDDLDGEELYWGSFEQSYLDAGMKFKVTDCVSVEFVEDEVRVAYWWGNSNLYHPFTLDEWHRALAQVRA